MSIHTDSMELLEEIYHCCKTNQSFNLSQDYLFDLLPNKYHDLEMQVDYLRDAGYVSDFAPTCGFPISLKITSKGIMAIENVSTPVATSNVTNIYGSNFGIAGNNNSSNTVNNTFNYSNLQNIIDNSPYSDNEKQMLLNELKPLYDRIELGAPLEKGMLSSISDKIKDYQPLLGAVLSSLTTFLTTPK
ncbi:MAG: hypothetical protein ACLS3B_03960 [Veillonella atypica]|uniref:hypothetical protein n=1 Tax=Veillonella atypica TaxID=39777 RepID=UPI0039910513